MDGNDPFSRELRSARDRIAELQRRSTAGSQPGGGLLPEALAELDEASEELWVTGQELYDEAAGRPAPRQALEAERERYQALFDFAPVAYLVTDPVARILEANRAAAVLLDVDQRFLVGKPLAAYVASEDRWQFRSTVNWLRKGDGNGAANLPVQFRRHGGGLMEIAVTVQPVQDRAGVLRTLLWLVRNVSCRTTSWRLSGIMPANSTWRRWPSWTRRPTSMGRSRSCSTPACASWMSTGSASCWSTGRGGFAPSAGPTRPASRSCGPRSTWSKGRAGMPSCWNGRCTAAASTATRAGRSWPRPPPSTASGPSCHARSACCA